LNKKSKKDVNTHFGTAGFVNAYIPDSCFFFNYTLSNRDKWTQHQAKLREFFVENPSPMKNPRPQLNPLQTPLSPLQTPSSQNSFSGVMPPLQTPNAPPGAAAPIGGANIINNNHVHFAATIPAPPPSVITMNGATAQAFDPMLLLQQLSAKMLTPQQPQTIVFESRADKLLEP